MVDLALIRQCIQTKAHVQGWVRMPSHSDGDVKLAQCHCDLVAGEDDSMSTKI